MLFRSVIRPRAQERYPNTLPNEPHSTPAIVCQWKSEVTLSSLLYYMSSRDRTQGARLARHAIQPEELSHWNRNYNLSLNSPCLTIIPAHMGIIASIPLLYHSSYPFKHLLSSQVGPTSLVQQVMGK